MKGYLLRSFNDHISKRENHRHNIDEYVNRENSLEPIFKGTIERRWFDIYYEEGIEILNIMSLNESELESIFQGVIESMRKRPEGYWVIEPFQLISTFGWFFYRILQRQQWLFVSFKSGLHLVSRMDRVEDMIFPTSISSFPEMLDVKEEDSSFFKDWTEYFCKGKVRRADVQNLLRITECLYHSDLLLNYSIFKLTYFLMTEYALRDYSILVELILCDKSKLHISKKERNRLMHALNGNTEDPAFRYVKSFLGDTYVSRVNGKYVKDYQEKEWLGDSIANCEICLYLYEKFDGLDDLDRLKSFLVRGTTMADFISISGIDKILSIKDSTAGERADFFEVITAELFMKGAQKNFIRIYVDKMIELAPSVVHKGMSSFHSWHINVYNKEPEVTCNSSYKDGQSKHEMELTLNGLKVKGVFPTVKIGLQKLGEMFYVRDTYVKTEAGLYDRMRERFLIPRKLDPLGMPGTIEGVFMVEHLGLRGYGNSRKEAQDNWATRVVKSDKVKDLERRTPGAISSEDEINGVNYKGILQTQGIRRYGEVPKYNTVQVGRNFESTAMLKDFIATGVSTTRREAERLAAEKIVSMLPNHQSDHRFEGS